MTFKEVIFGTSVFTFAQQFGHRSRLYELDFKKQPENVEKLLNYAYDKGNLDTLMLRNSDDLIAGVDLSIKSGHAWSCIGFTSEDNFNSDMELFSKYEMSTVILDGFFVDKCIKKGEIDRVVDYLKRLSGEYGYVAGIETRMPFNHLDKIYNSDIFKYMDVIMLPINFYGYMMDCNFLNKENRKQIDELLSLYDEKKVIANRTLAAGVLSPTEAYQFMKDVKYVDAVCVGMSKEAEIDETMKTIHDVMS